MAPKSTTGKTNKYSGVVKSVQKTQQPEEPKITAEQVHAAFKSFGFNPNERNHNDIGYWTMRPVSDGAKLMEELHKRRIDINKKEDEDKKALEDRQKVDRKAEDDKKSAHESILNKQHIDKAAMPRLSDEDLNALFDEYGLPAPDPEWARSHLPNDPKKIRSILEMQRKTADDMLKKHSKNAVNSIAEVPKVQNQTMTPMNSVPGMGMGGPASPMGMQGAMSGDSPVTPFFVGDHALIKIISPHNPQSGTLWLVDKKKKVLRPIGSEKMLDSAFEDPEAAKNSIVTVSAQALGPGGPLEGFTPLGEDKGLQEDGSMDNIDFSPGQLQNRYGKQSDPGAENKALSMLDGITGQLNKPQ